MDEDSVGALANEMWYLPFVLSALRVPHREVKYGTRSTHTEQLSEGLRYLRAVARSLGLNAAGTSVEGCWQLLRPALKERRRDEAKVEAERRDQENCVRQ